MFRPRVIPVLLVSEGKLVKSVRFSHHRYIGDPINAARIFSDFEADELIVLQIDATRNQQCITPAFIQELSNETRMPLGVGGGIKTLKQIEQSLLAGAEKVILGTAVFQESSFLNSAAKEFGSSTISVCVDYYSDNGHSEVRYLNGTKRLNTPLPEITKQIENDGAGEIILQAIQHDGTRNGYDLETIRLISEKLSIPVVAMGGCNELSDMHHAYNEGFASAMAAGSMFVYYRNGVLISYPEKSELVKLFDL